MSTSPGPSLLSRAEHLKAIVVQIHAPSIRDIELLTTIRDALYREAESADRTLILDLSEVEYLTSAAVGWLITLRRKLMSRGLGFQAPCRRRTLFGIYSNATAALEAIDQGEQDPLLLCGVSKDVKDIFLVC